MFLYYLLLIFIEVILYLKINIKHYIKFLKYPDKLLSFVHRNKQIIIFFLFLLISEIEIAFMQNIIAYVSNTKCYICMFVFSI